MTKGDKAVEHGADKLEDLATKVAARGGVGSKLAGELAADASFLRKLKPSLIVARAKGEAPKNHEPGSTNLNAPSGPQHAKLQRDGSGPNPFVVAGAAFGLGTLLAKAIDWRGHAHPRR